MAVTAGRFYFKREGVELKDHALNGSVVAGAGPAVDPVAYNKPKSSSWDRRRNEIQIFLNGKEQKITTAYFDDQPVEVYEWWPNPEARSTYMLVPKITKSGVFDNDVRAGYYEQSRTTEQEFYADFVRWMQDQGVPAQYSSKLASYAWQRGHSSGYVDVLNISYDLVEVFK